MNVLQMNFQYYINQLILSQKHDQFGKMFRFHC